MIVLAVWLLLLRAHRVAGSDRLGKSFSHMCETEMETVVISIKFQLFNAVNHAKWSTRIL